MTPRVVALDLAPSATGIAWRHDGVPTTSLVPLGVRTAAPRTSGQERVWDITVAVAAVCNIDPQLVVIERPFVRHDHSTMTQVELHGVVKQWLYTQSYPWVYVSPMTRAVYATGTGNADKTAVLRAVRLTYGHLLGGPSGVADHNAADALVLLCMALDHYGHPLADLPDTHRRALSSVEWPATLGCPLSGGAATDAAVRQGLRASMP